MAANTEVCGNESYDSFWQIATNGATLAALSVLAMSGRLHKLATCGSCNMTQARHPDVPQSKQT